MKCMSIKKIEDEYEKNPLVANEDLIELNVMQKIVKLNLDKYLTAAA